MEEDGEIGDVVLLDGENEGGAISQGAGFPGEEVVVQRRCGEGFIHLTWVGKDAGTVAGSEEEGGLGGGELGGGPGERPSHEGFLSPSRGFLGKVGAPSYC